MVTARADFYFFGYREIIVGKENIALATSILLQNGVNASVNDKGSIYVKEKDIVKIQNLLSGRMYFSLSEPKGVYGAWKKSRNKAAVIICLVISIFILTFSQSIIWDIRPSGNENIGSSDMKTRLEACGFSIGDLWREKSLSEVETELLKRYNDISWVNINRRGTVAYVSIIEKEIESPESNSNILYSNIVAAYDCVIDEVTVKSGTAMVKAGESVKRGDLLILGANANGDFCRAEGMVIGRVSDNLTVDVKKEYENRRISSKKLHEATINIFKISINIFKTYGNLTNECDIIDDVKEYSLPNGVSLPFSITLRYLPSYTCEGGSYSDGEMVALAKDRLNLEMVLMLAGSDLVRISSYGEFTDDGYRMWSDIVYLTDVGRENSFEITE